MLANHTQEQTDRENREHCRRIAEEIELIAAGNAVRCPVCGEFVELDEGRENDDGGTLHTCPECGAEYAEDDAEPASLYDYFADALDIEYTVGSREHDFRGVRIMVACGGPNIYVDSMARAVKLYWWTDRAEYPLLSEAVEALEEFGEELYSC